jgi:signal transduction histidine kinase
MGIRKKVLIYFSLTAISLTGVLLFFIYTLFAQYREEEFHQRQKEKIKSTLFFLSEYKEADRALTDKIDRLTLNDLYNEKLLIFNERKELIYSSIDDTPVYYSKEILESLSAENVWYEGQEAKYDVVGLYFYNEGKVYYGISKALDLFGFSKLDYLRYILLFSFVAFTLIVLIVSYIQAKKITDPLESITRQIESYNFEHSFNPIQFQHSGTEIAILAHQFNKLMSRMNEVFSFQKHAIHHISHELKTPIAVLVSNFERMQNEEDLPTLKRLMENQKEDTKRLGEIINSLLEIAKTESGNELKTEEVRIDELIFDIADELKNIYPDFRFSIEYELETGEVLPQVNANTRLLRAAILNLMQNCIQFSTDKRAAIKMKHTSTALIVEFDNAGPALSENEEHYLFQHFFRGANSVGIRGFGLGLVFVHRILKLHNGIIEYQRISPQANRFIVSLPLS